MTRNPGSTDLFHLNPSVTKPISSRPLSLIYNPSDPGRTGDFPNTVHCTCWGRSILYLIKEKAALGLATGSDQKFLKERYCTCTAQLYAVCCTLDSTLRLGVEQHKGVFKGVWRPWSDEWGRYRLSLVDWERLAREDEVW